MPDPELTPAMAPPAVAGVRALIRRWWVVALCAAAGVAVAFAYYRWKPRTYAAELVVVPKRSPSDMLGGRNLLGNLPLDLGAASSLGQSDADRIAAILESRSVTDEVIAKFDLVNRYEAGYLERTRKALWSRCETAVDKKPSLVRLTCEDPDPALARDLTNAIGQLADGVFRRIALASAAQERAFFAKRVEEARRDMEASSEALRAFQVAHKIVDLPEQGRAVVSGIAALEGSLISKRLELAYARGFAANDEASVDQLRRQIGAVSAELRAREERQPGEPGGARRAGSQLFPPAMELPALGAQLETLLRDHKIHETVFLMLTERYEARKLDEARDQGTFVVVDEAVLPTYRIRPTLRVLPVGMLAGLVLGIVLVIVPVWWRDLRRRAALEAQR